MIIIRASMRIKNGKEAAAMAACRAVVAGTQKEAGCNSYSYTIDLDDPALMHVLEIWDDEAALMGHLQGEPFKAFMAVALELMDPVGMAAWNGDMQPYNLAL